jgi:hypothetical protein
LLATPDPHDDLRARIDRHIDEHLADPTLSPRALASALFVSPRHLHALLAEDGPHRRGDDPPAPPGPLPGRPRRPGAGPHAGLGDRPALGVANATRFGQLVRSTTGRTPVAYRRAMLDGTA